MSRLNHLYSPPELGAPGKRQALNWRRDLSMAGLFVLAMGGIVVGILVLLAPGLLSGYTLKTYFPDADGIDSGIDVMQEGYVIGRIRSLEPVFKDDRDRSECPETSDPRAPALPCFRATLNIKQNWPVPADSVVQLAPAGLLQSNLLRVLPGTAKATLEKGSTIPSIARQPGLITEVQTTLALAQRTIDETIRPTLVQVQERIQSLLAMFQDEQEGAEGDGLGAEIGQGLTSVVGNLTRLSSDIEQSIDPEKIQAILSSAQTLSYNLAKISEALPAQTTAVRGAVDNYSALATDIRQMVNTTRPTLQGSIEDVQYVLDELSAALAPILANVEDASRNLSALSRDLRENPASLLHGRERKDQSPWFKQ